MCSIIGYYGSGKAAPIMVSGLKRMEYRGYDSVGIATKVENAVQIRKGVGRVDEVNRAENLDGLDGTVGIGHTRWATHGKVTRSNAHHASNTSTFTSNTSMGEFGTSFMDFSSSTLTTYEGMSTIRSPIIM